MLFFGWTEEPKEAAAEAADNVGKFGNIVIGKGTENLPAQVDHQYQYKGKGYFALGKIGKGSQQYHHKYHTAGTHKGRAEKKHIKYTGYQSGKYDHNQD
jgi:hypothetical protein